MARKRLSVVVITLNEEANIRRCLESVPFADEIVIVDSGSSDRTCSIAGEFTNKLLFHEFQGFGSQKQYAVDHAAGDWILSLDADEWVSDTLRSSFESFLNSPQISEDFSGYMIYRRNIFFGRPMRFCGWYVPILRLFRRGCGRFNEKLVHEEIIVDGQLGFLGGDIIHDPYRDISQLLMKMQRYISLDAQGLANRGCKVYGWQSPIHLGLRPLWKFIEKYFLQQGFREGLHGLVLSCMAAFGVFLMHAECWQRQKHRAYRENASCCEMDGRSNFSDIGKF